MVYNRLIVQGEQSRRQRGVASIIITLVSMIIISLIVLGFAAISRREQRQSLDQQLSAQAFYAAESGVEDARQVIKSDLAADRELQPKDNCRLNNSAPAYPTGPATVLDAVNGVEYTCLLVDLAPRSLEHTGVDAGGIVVPINVDRAIERLEITWRPSSPPSGTPTSCPTTATGVFSPQPRWNCGYGVLRTEIVPMDGAVSRAGLMSAALNTFAVPARNGNGQVSYAGNVGRANTSAGDCNDTSYTECKITITALPNQLRFGVRLNSLYQSSNIRVVAFSGGEPLRISGSQALIDSTGKASDVLRRIQVRLPLTDAGDIPPASAIESAGSVCKRFASAPNVFVIPGDIVEPDIDNAMCRARQDATSSPASCTPNRDVAIVADVSSSMSTRWQSATRIDKLREASTQFVNTANISDPNNRSSLVTFSSTGTVVQQLTGDTTRLRSAIAAMSLSPANNTYYIPGLDRADQELFGPRGRATSPKVVIFISDGAPENGVNDPDPPESRPAIIAKANDLKARNVRIYTIGIGDRNDPDAVLEEDLLNAMSGNGGNFVDAESESQLDAAMAEIANTLGCS